MTKLFGFTLVELLICLVMVAILMGIAYPSYQNFIIKARRADAQNELLKAQIQQSNYRITHPTYIDNSNATGLPSNNIYYTFSVVSASAHTYLMKAEAKINSSQNNDELACKSLFIDQNSRQTIDGEIENTACWSQR
jgi:type IV pilus assembly protein PilE